MKIYKTIGGETLTEITHKHYSQQIGAVNSQSMINKVMLANPHLLSLGHFLPMGIDVYLPTETKPTKQTKRRKLWPTK